LESRCNLSPEDWVYVFATSIFWKQCANVDVAIDAQQQLSFKEFLSLGSELELMLRMHVDLANIRQVPVPLQKGLLTNGTLIKHSSDNVVL
jgi:hypothetical protein